MRGVLIRQNIGFVLAALGLIMLVVGVLLAFSGIPAGFIIGSVGGLLLISGVDNIRCNHRGSRTHEELTTLLLGLSIGLGLLLIAAVYRYQ